MNKPKNYLLFSRLLVVLMLGGYFLYNLPFITNISLKYDSWLKLFNNEDGLYLPILKSLFLAFIQATVILYLSLFLSMLLINIKLVSPISNYLSVLILPIILGNVAIAFLYKIILLKSDVFFTGPLSKFGILTFIQFWQYGSLIIYLFWLNLQTVPKAMWDYADAIKLNDFSKIKDIILPKQFNLVILLFIITFVFCYYETSKIEFIFKSSRGTDTELVSQWLNRTFHSDTLLNANYAFINVSKSSFYVFVSALLVLVFSILINNIVLKISIKNRLSIKKKLLPSDRVSKMFAVLLILWIVGPILYGVSSQLKGFNLNIRPLIPTIIVTGIAALISTTISIYFGISSRIGFQKTLSEFNKGSYTYILLMFSLILVPPIILLVLGFKWMKLIGYNSLNNIYISWVIGQALLSFPILTSFTAITHFRVENKSIQYLNAHLSSLSEKLRDLFFLPFQGDYLLTYLLAFAMIFNEGPINNILSDVIPSFTNELNKTITGRAADYSNGMNYFLISFFLAVSCLTLWNYLLNKYQNSQEL